MPTGKPISREKRELILRLNEQGVKPVQIAAQLRLCADAVRNVLHRADKWKVTLNNQST